MALNLIGRVVVLFQLAQVQAGTVVHRDFDGRAGIVLDGNVLEVGDEADVLQSLFVLFHVFVGLGRTLVIVESHARRNDVEHDRALVRDGGLQHGAELALVAGERAADQGRAELNRQRAGVDRRKIVDHAGLQLRAQVGGGRELALGEAVDAVVLDDVNDGQIAAHQVDELSDADRSGIAVAADADADQLAIRQHGSGRD